MSSGTGVGDGLSMIRARAEVGVVDQPEDAQGCELVSVEEGMG